MRFTNADVFLGTIFAFYFVKPEIPPMNINTIPTKKLALLCTAFCAAAMLAFTPNAKALDLRFNDQYVVGTITPGAPAIPKSGRLGKLYDYSLGRATVVHDFGQARSRPLRAQINDFPNLPNVLSNGSCVR